MDCVEEEFARPSIPASTPRRNEPRTTPVGYRPPPKFRGGLWLYKSGEGRVAARPKTNNMGVSHSRALIQRHIAPQSTPRAHGKFSCRARGCGGLGWHMGGGSRVDGDAGGLRGGLPRVEPAAAGQSRHERRAGVCAVGSTDWATAWLAGAHVRELECSGKLYREDALGWPRLPYGT